MGYKSNLEMNVCSTLPCTGYSKFQYPKYSKTLFKTCNIMVKIINLRKVMSLYGLLHVYKLHMYYALYTFITSTKL